MTFSKFAAAAVSLAMPAALFAGGHEGGGAPSGPPGGPPPEVLSQMKLGGAGILGLMYNEREYGLLNSRTGESRSRIGNATSPAGPGDYAHEGSSFVAPLFFRRNIEGTTGYLMGRVVFGSTTEAENVTYSDSTTKLAWVGYQNFYSPEAMYSIQLGVLDLDSEGPATEVTRDAVNLRLDYARLLNDNWGFAGRVFFSNGENSVLLKGPGLSYTQTENQVYVQAELGGNFTADDLGFVPQGWSLRPVIGANYQQFSLEDTTNSFGGPEPGGTFEVGNAWAKATLAKGAPPGNWAPFVTAGLETAFADDYGDFIDEDTHAILGVGATYMVPGGGTNIAISLDHREGLNGARSNTALTTVLNVSF